MRQPLLVVLLLFAFSLVGCSSSSSDASSLDNQELPAIVPLPSTSPENVGLDNAKLNGLTQALEQGQYGEVHSVIVERHGQVVLEKYFRGWSQLQFHRMYSVTKSVTSTAIGMAYESGQLPALETPILNILTDYPNIADADERKSRIRVIDLLTMRAGFTWDENSNYLTDSTNDATLLGGQTADWIQYMLNRPMSHEPGSYFTYNSGATMLLSGILQKTTGKSAEDFVAEQLFRPLQITHWQWDQGPNGLTNTGWGLWLRPLDMVRLGRLVVNKGIISGQRLVSEEWIDNAIAHQVEPNVNLGSFEYGYQWWGASDSHAVVEHLASNDLAWAWGFGGQFIFVVPHLDMVVVMTGANLNGSSSVILALRDHVFPAVTGP